MTSLNGVTSCKINFRKFLIRRGLRLRIRQILDAWSERRMFLAQVVHIRSAADVIYRRRPHLKIYRVPAELSLNGWAFNSEQRLALTNKELVRRAKVQFKVHVAFARGLDATSAACYVGGLPSGCSSVRWLTIWSCHVQRCSGSLTNGAAKGPTYLTQYF